MFWNEKTPSEKKHFLLFKFESHNLKPFFNIVTIQIEALIIVVHKLINSIVIEFCRLRLQPLIHACLPACSRRRSAVLRARSSCSETSGSHLAQDPDCVADDQTPPIQNDPRALECDWPCAGGRCHEKTNPWNSIFPDACFESLFLTFSMFHNISQSLLLNHVRGNPPEAHPPCPKKRSP